MGSRTDQEQAARRRKQMMAAMAVVVGLAIVIPTAGALLQHLFGASRTGTDVVPTSSAPSGPPAVTIAPLQVRPVVNAVGAAPEQCPVPGPIAAAAPVDTCDFAKTTLYTLGPEGVALQLIRADSLLSPITNGYIVQVSMTPEAATAFERFTAANIGRQVAFIRAGVVVSAPKISEPITGATLQLSGDLTADQSTEMARLLRDET
jgi:hypothetical protein